MRKRHAWRLGQAREGSGHDVGKGEEMTLGGLGNYVGLVCQEARARKMPPGFMRLESDNYYLGRGIMLVE